MRPLLVPLFSSERIADPLAETLRGEVGTIHIRRFPDGESYVRYETSVEARDVVLICALDRPDDKFLPLIFAAAAARENGAKTVGLVAPYLAYMRQDQRFQAGEGVTAKHFAAALSPWIDWIVTIDPHLHRITSLSDVYSVPAFVAHAAPVVSAWIKEHVKNPVLVGPDSESEQWVSETAKTADAPFLVLEKTRRGDRDVEVSVPNVEQWRSHTPVLVDDIISTARTMIETVGHLRAAGMAPPICIGVHAVFAGNAFDDLIAAGAGQIVTTNTIAHESNAPDVSPLLAESVRFLLKA
ncbi:ribose-phosphate pyrophosphokinase [Marinicaulis aureus]|uniref:ribose-phosphate diphosphokinase n=1 Tax=Hyphococcus aureus TaxID=2666033 RepID=A0ABW1L024_9PROT